MIRGFRGTISKLYPAVTLKSIIFYTTLICACILSFVIRILPIRWGQFLSEFDPFYHYRVAEYIEKHGLKAFFTWHDYRSWFPSGRNIPNTTPIGLPLAAVCLHLLLTWLGLRISLMDVCIYFPALFGVATCIAIYFLGKEIGGKKVGLLSTIILAFSPAHIERTYLGFFKHETVGIITVILASLFFLRSIKPDIPKKRSFLYATLAGLFLGYLYASWGAASYQLGLLTLFTLALILIGRYRSRLLFSYTITTMLGLGIASLSPRPGISILSSIMAFAAYLLIYVLSLLEIAKRIKTWKTRFATILTLLIATAIMFLLISPRILLLGGKFLYVVVPILRREMPMPIVESVAEHRSATWDSFFLRFNFLLLLALTGIVHAIRKLNDEHLFATLFGLTSLYFAASYIRLVLIMGPAFIILASLGALSLLNLIRAEITKKPRLELMPALLRSAILALVFLLILPPIIGGIDFAYTPVTIASSTIPIRRYYSDWLETCAWLRDNTHVNAVVCSWWDYGYYITILGDRISLSDNSTINSTQIRKIALAFTSNESIAIKILSQYGVDYIAVFTTIREAKMRGYPFYWGDEAKWHWMASIAGLDREVLKDPELPRRLGLPWGIELPKGDILLTKLMIYGALDEEQFKPDNLTLVFRSSNKLVLIYSLNKTI